MKLEDLDAIRELAAERERNTAILERMNKTNPRLVLGIGTDSIEIRMPPSLQRLVDESLREALTSQIAEADEKLRALGVEV
jgi:hypothetical protein